MPKRENILNIGVKHAAALFCLALATIAAPAWAYRPVDATWPTGATTLQIGDLSAPWNSAFIEAAARWHDTAAGITINLQQGVTSRACDLDDQNGVWWADEECDGPWDDSTLAVTYYWFYQESREMVEADMIFNPNWPFQIYDGAGRLQPDFSRTAGSSSGPTRWSFGCARQRLRAPVCWRSSSVPRPCCYPIR